jgi:hypothetical protein
VFVSLVDERAAGFGLPQDKICQLVVSERIGRPIDDDALRKAFRAELDRGMALADYQMADALYTNAVEHNNTAEFDRMTKRPRLAG